MKLQSAAGGIVMRMAGEQPEVLLIKDSYGHWIWPKGHIEKGETSEKAAMREVGEETGLKSLEMLKKLGKQEYFFTLEGERIFKTVHVFLFEASAGEKLDIQVSEIQDGRWLEPEEALEKIEYEGSRALLEKGIKAFRNKYR